MNILIAAGGTGGHLYPGLALARELRTRGHSPLFVVRENDACREILAEEGMPFTEIPIRGMPRRISLKIAPFLIYLLKGLFVARRLIGKTKPGLIIGMGGYISFPVVLLGRCMGAPTLIHEQNCLPGMSNRILALFAEKVAVSFPESLRYFSGEKAIVTGNPVRAELFSTIPEDGYRSLRLDPRRFTVLVFGGSQGAASINRVVAEAARSLSRDFGRIQFLHIAGRNGFEETQREYCARGIPGTVLPYLHRIGEAYATADLVICRSGATTVTELLILRKPAILIPYPLATGNHQEYNARLLADAGLGTVLLERELSPERIAQSIQTHLKAFKSHEHHPSLPLILPQQRIADAALAVALNR